MGLAISRQTNSQSTYPIAVAISVNLLLGADRRDQGRGLATVTTEYTT
jgi:hypothetical protein